MVARNDITGEPLISKTNTNEYRKGFDGIDWSKKSNTEPEAQEVPKEEKDE